MPDMRPIQEVPWFQKVRRRDRWLNCESEAVLSAASTAESLRATFNHGPIPLRDFVKYSAWLDEYGRNVTGWNSEAVQKLVETTKVESPFWTDQNMKLIRGMAMLGFEFIVYKQADGAAAVAGEFSR